VKKPATLDVSAQTTPEFSRERWIVCQANGFLPIAAFANIWEYLFMCVYCMAIFRNHVWISWFTPLQISTNGDVTAAGNNRPFPLTTIIAKEVEQCSLSYMSPIGPAGNIS